ncbi:sensor histidine kinase [Leucobacter aridicollis]|uniref:Two-component system sensor histidine kinase DesK n=1 Tax=Leucobacter aridicollis TaxID=283878 RepID=A0A852RJN6_9MICO|nr:histidine kinase [Leucobacter aridicollis]MBL3682048.1 sensor histidine kinase [Leucobacter aridicollis]NYD26902.1 two-component system sensor histidine kinase DesK [Leucobacter aridicollis]
MSEPSHTEPTNAWARFGWLMGGIWLVFLYFPATALLRSEGPVLAVAVGWFGVAAFAATYLTGFIVGMRAPHGRERPATVWLFVAAIASAALTIPAIGWGVTSFTPFLMSYASYLLNRPTHWVANTAGPALIVFEIATAQARGDVEPWPLLWITVMIAAVNTINSWLIARSTAADELRVELATSEGREAVARDVHDLLGHSLTVVKLKAELASRLLERDPAAARAELDEIVRLTGEAIDGVRGTVTGVRSEGLAEQLAATADALATAGVALEVRGSASSLSPAQAIPAAWILREATTNILRHADASRAVVSISPGTLSISDNGRGLAPDPGLGGDAGTPAAGTHTAGAQSTRATGHGLRGMSERAAEAGAELRVTGALGHGTKVSLTW